MSGTCRAWVNVTDEDHNFCNAKEDEHVLQSNGTGPHKIIYKPTGTGEVEAVILLYAADDSQLIAEALLAEDLCPTDAEGTGTGGEDETVEVVSAKLMPDCTPFTPNRVVNPKNHRGPAYSKVTMHRRFCPDGQEEYVIDDVELRKFCPVAGVEDRESCLVGWGLGIGAEWCPADEPTDTCVIVEYTDCDVELPPCDTTLVWDPLYACCGDNVWGSGTGGTGSGT